MDCTQFATYRQCKSRKVARGEPGTFRQQMMALSIYLDAIESRTYTDERSKNRLWYVCHCLATDRQIEVAQ